jgi:5-methylcytosine-specific restriction endonuclease McrA
MSLASSIARTRHHAYLRSPEWRDLRRLALERDAFRCRLCNSRWRLEVHHRRYPPPWEADQLSNLSTLCRNCHGSFHRRAHWQSMLNRVLLAILLLGALLLWRDVMVLQ